MKRLFSRRDFRHLADYFANPSLNHLARNGGLSWPGLGYAVNFPGLGQAIPPLRHVSNQEHD